MPLTPVTWRSQLAVNTNTNGAQTDPVITQLSNGNVLITWVDFDETAGSAGGTHSGADIIGRIFDPLGNAVTGEIRLNVALVSEEEQGPEITALADGGFMVVYESLAADNDIGYETYNAAGVRQDGGYIINDLNGGDAPHDPTVASATAISAMTAYVVDNADGSEQVFVRSYNPTADTLGLATSIFLGAAGAGNDIDSVSLAALSNNNFALVFANRNFGDDTVELRILNSAGAPVNSATVITGVELSDAKCIGLSGGNVALVYTNITSGTINAAVYSNTAGVVRATYQVSDLTGGQNEPAVCALSDGGFVVVWDDDTNSDIRGQRFDNTGASVGSEFVIDTSGAQSAPSIVGLDDGRFQVTWLEDGDIQSEIFDVRDSVNNPGVYTPDQWQVGTVNADVLTSNGGAEIVHGWDGNDVITETPLGTQQIFGDAGNDTVNVVSDIVADSWDGGASNDTIDWSAVAESGATFDLAVGTATDTALNVEQMLNFENLIGTANRDVINGSAGANYLNAGAGNDDVYSGAGNDTLLGGTGNDQLFGGAENDYFDGGTGDDRIDGGAGVDLVDYSAAGAALYIDLRVAVQANTGGLGTDSISTLENVIGGAFGDVLIGDANVNILYGGAGGDSLVTLEGNDFGYGGAGDDYLAGRDDNDTLFGGENNDVIDGGSGLDTLYGDSGIDYIIGGGDSDTIYGGDGSDQWLGGDSGNDFIYGGLGADRLSGGDGNDTLTAGAGIDYMTGEAGMDTFVYNAPSEGSISEQIGDWQGGVDKLRIDASAFGGGLFVGALAANRLVIGVAADQAFGQFLYNAGNGVLYWDADGTSGGAAVAFTRLFTSAFTLPPATIAVTDFDVVV